MVTLADIKLMGKVGHQAGEAGSALLASVLLITLITGAGLAAMTTISSSQNKAKNLINEKQAFYLAEAGLAHGMNVLNQYIAANSNNFPPPGTLIASTSLAGVGSYTVTVQAASGVNTLLMTATGSAPNNASTSMSSLLTIGYSNYGSAFITGQDLTISGNPTIDGSAGGVYANRNLTISGKPQIATEAAAVGTYTVTSTGAPVVNGFAGGGQPSIPVNYVEAWTFYGTGAIDYYLWNDGSVYNSNGCCNVSDQLSPPGTSTWNCWTHSGANWTVTCSTPPNGTYWVYGHAMITSNVGTLASPWVATILSYYAIEVSSTNLYMRPPAQADGSLYKSLTQNYLLVSGRDLKIDGTATQNFSGIARAYEQVSVSGNPNFNGYIIAQDSSSIYSRVTANAISGNMHLTYNGNLSNGLQGTVQSHSTLY